MGGCPNFEVMSFPVFVPILLGHPVEHFFRQFCVILVRNVLNIQPIPVCHISNEKVEKHWHLVRQLIRIQKCIVCHMPDIPVTKLWAKM